METSEVQEPTKHPAIFLHCQSVYAEMLKQSEQSSNNVEGPVLTIYTGMGTRLFQKLGLGNPYYTAVMRRLMDMDCIRQLSRGGGGQPSKWLLMREPDIELWAQFPEGSRGRYGRTATKQQVPEQHFKDLAQQVSELRQDVENLKAVVYNGAA